MPASEAISSRRSPGVRRRDPDASPTSDGARRARPRRRKSASSVAARPDDPEPAKLVAELRAAGEEFARLWEEHQVAVRRSSTKRFRHPSAGLLELDCEVPLNQDHHHMPVIHTTRPGSESYERLRLLRVVGLQELSPSETQTP